MDLKIEKIQLSLEKEGVTNIDYKKEYTDVFVYLENGDIYVASFFTYQYLSTVLLNKQEQNSKYLLLKSMVVIEKCTKPCIKDVIEELMEEGDFHLVFKRL